MTPIIGPHANFVSHVTNTNFISSGSGKPFGSLKSLKKLINISRSHVESLQNHSGRTNSQSQALFLFFSDSQSN